MSNVYMIRAHRSYQVPYEGIAEEIRNGKARMGWSIPDSADLRKVQENRGDYDREIKDSLGFLEMVDIDDILIYPNQPQSRHFMICRVTGKYDYLPSSEGIDTEWGPDFRSYRPCEIFEPFSSSVSFDHPAIPPRMKVAFRYPRRFKPIESELFEEFKEGYLKFGPDPQEERDSVGKINIEMRQIFDMIPDLIEKEFPEKRLSLVFCKNLFERMGYRYKILEGKYEAGTDVLVYLHEPLLGEEAINVGVQCFAYRGEVSADSIEGKLKQLTAGWETNSLHRGVLFTTGQCNDEAREIVSQHNEDDPSRPVALVDATGVTELFLRYFSSMR